jgi:hypothetical protein
MSTAQATPAATPDKIKVLASRTLIFAEGQGTTGRRVQVAQKPGVQEVDAWIQNTPTFQAGKQDGSIVLVTGRSPLAVVDVPPTVDEIMAARGCTTEEAQKIVDLETVKFNQGEYPYPPKVKVVDIQPENAKPTIESLMAAGLTQAQAEAALAVKTEAVPVQADAATEAITNIAAAQTEASGADSVADTKDIGDQSPKTTGNVKKNGK